MRGWSISSFVTGSAVLSLPFGRKIIRRAAGQSGDSVERYERPAQDQPCLLRAREALLISSERGLSPFAGSGHSKSWILPSRDPREIGPRAPPSKREGRGAAATALDEDTAGSCVPLPLEGGAAAGLSASVPSRQCPTCSNWCRLPCCPAGLAVAGLEAYSRRH